MKLFVADYLADTTHLTRGEHGAYLLLLMAMWRAGGKLPARDDKLAQITKCAPREWAEIKDSILALFQRRGGQLTHKRLGEELAEYRALSEVRKQASDKGVSEKRRKNRRRGEPHGSPNADHLVTSSQSDSKKPPKPPGGPIALDEWAGPPEILAGLSTIHRDGQLWALSYLRHCRYEPGPPACLVASRGHAFDMLRQEASAELRAMGLTIRLEQAA